MKRNYLGLIVFLCFSSVFSQTVAFEEILPSAYADLENVNNGSVVFTDIENDNDQDIIISGINKLDQNITKLYENDGSNRYFELVDIPFEGVAYSSIAIADVDNDGDQDVLITGINNSNQKITKLYLNDGSGNYSEVLDTPFDGVGYSSVAFADIDNDNDQDLLITGSNNTNHRISKLYSNDGAGNFTEILEMPFEGVSHGSVAFADIDNDNDEDLLITGIISSSESIAILYDNDGNGIYSEIASENLEVERYGPVAFGDVDNDNDLDLFISSILYLNDGTGNFTDQINPQFFVIGLSSIDLADFNNDDKLDVMITGQSSQNRFASIIYTNDGVGNFSEFDFFQFTGVGQSSVACADVDNDNDQDVILTGYINYEPYTSLSKLYLNDGAAHFESVNVSSIEGVEDGGIVFADFDNDEDQDFIITGSGMSKQYKNDGLGNFEEINDTTFTRVTFGSVAIADYDNDNDQDVLISGDIPWYTMEWGNHTIPSSTLYTNDGQGNFTEYSDYHFYGKAWGTKTFVDIDNDDDQDIILSGQLHIWLDYWFSIMYINDGNGNFTSELNLPFDSLGHNTIAFADIDNDDDQDFINTGVGIDGYVSKLYVNDGQGNFSEKINMPFVGFSESIIVFADVDNDNDKDVLISGKLSTGLAFTELYDNDGQGNYTVHPNTSFPAVLEQTITFADVDNDHDQDLLITGKPDGLPSIAKLYVNDGNGNFTEVLDLPFESVYNGAVAFADIDKDDDLDLIISGRNEMRNDPVAKIYRNNTCVSKTVDYQSACNSYTWLNGLTYASSNYKDTLLFTNKAGCDSIVRLNLIIHEVEVSSTDTSISAKLEGASYQWLDCNDSSNVILGATEQMFMPIENGTYALELTEGSCIDTSICIDIIHIGIKEIFIFNQVSIYPNPNTGLVNVKLGELKDVTISVFNANSKMIYNQNNINTNLHQLNINDAPGIYIIEVYSEGLKQKYKLIKK